MLPDKIRRKLKVVCNRLDRHDLKFFSDSDIATLQQESAELLSEGAAAHSEWIGFQRKILEAFVSDPENFLRADIVAHTLHPAQYGLSSKLIKELLDSPKAERYLPLLSESPVGNPLRDPATSCSSPVLVQHVHHAMKIEEVFGSIHGFERIIDIGGGYGGFTKVVKKFGFAGEYVVFDLPVMHRIQNLYLRKVFGFLEDCASVSAIKRYSKPSQLQDHLKDRSGRTLLVATWSLSEMPIALRDELLEIMPSVDCAYIAFQSDFEGIDNLAYFRERFSESKHIAITPQKNFNNNFYLLVGLPDSEA